MRMPAVAVVLAVAGVLPPLAQAATADVALRRLVYAAAPGETNSLTVISRPDTYRLVDAGARIDPGRGCTAVSPSEVECKREGVRELDIRLGDGNDLVTVSGATPGDLRGGEGNDALEGGDGGDILRGDAGDDVLRGSAGLDALSGGGGADFLSGGTGFGSGFPGPEGEELDMELDAVLYVARARGVRVTLDGRRNDGEPGEGDLVAGDVEGALGGRGNDVLVGDNRLNILFGGGGDDVLRGRGGLIDFLAGERGNDEVSGGNGRFDFIEGGRGNDVLRGGFGEDGIDAGPGHDLIAGGPGGDQIMAGPGRDRVFAGGGSDRIFARDGARDTIAGGAGHDSALVDERLDRVFGVEDLGEQGFGVDGEIPGLELTGRAVAALRRR